MGFFFALLANLLGYELFDCQHSLWPVIYCFQQVFRSSQWFVLI